MYHGQVVLLTELLTDLGAHRSSYSLSPGTIVPKTRKHDQSPRSPQGNLVNSATNKDASEAGKQGTRESSSQSLPIPVTSLNCGDTEESLRIARTASCTSSPKREAGNGLGCGQGKRSDLAIGPSVLSKER
jgi:hypothetical protein